MAEFVAAKTGETEAQWRQFLAQLFTQGAFMVARNGVIGATGLGVAQTATASASVTVDSGLAVTQDTALNGASPLVNPSPKTLDILGANPMGGLPRNDIVVFDSATGTIRNIVGTPNASPTDPTVPATAVPLARLRHAASATTVPAAKIDGLRVWVAMRGGIAPANDQADRDTMFARPGTAVYRQDTDALEVYDGTNWTPQGVTSPAVAGKRQHWGTATVSIGTDGYVTGGGTVAHGAGFTPRIVQVFYLNTTGSLWGDILTDSYNATTFRCRMFGMNGAAPTSTQSGLPIGFVCYE